MAPPRTFDYDLLKKLVRDHPDWSYHEYARVLTEDTRDKTRDPNFPAIMPNTIAAAISRNRDRWRDEGIDVEDNRVPIYTELIPSSWHVAPAHRMDVPLRKLRALAAIRRGLHVEPRERRQALQFERYLNETKQVVDLSARGIPQVRPAEDWELNPDGSLIEVVAQPLRAAVRLSM